MEAGMGGMVPKPSMFYLSFDSGKAPPQEPLAYKNRARTRNTKKSVLLSHRPCMENFYGIQAWAFEVSKCWTWSATICFHYHRMLSPSLSGFCIKWCTNIQQRIGTRDYAVCREYFSERLLFRSPLQCKINGQTSLDVHINFPRNLPHRG